VTQNLIPHGERLRRAIRWLSDHAPSTQRAIEEASVRFDLSPQEEQFLLDYFRVKPDRESPPS